MSTTFQKRDNIEYGNAIVTYDAGDAWGKNPDLRMIYRVARKPDDFFDGFKDTPEWVEFLKKQGVEGAVDMSKGATLAAAELCRRILTPELLDKVSDNIIKQIKDNPERTIDKIRVSAPFPIDPAETTNRFAPAFAAAMSAGLEKFLPEKLKQAGLKPIEVIADLDPKKSSVEQTILNIVNNDRGGTSSPKEGKEVDVYMERVIRQPVYSGKVDKNAIYVPVDDFLVSQSTVAGLVNYIKSEGALSTPPVTGFKLFAGVEVLDTKKESLDFLNKAISDIGEHQLKTYGGVEGFKKELAQTLASVGLGIDFKDPKKNSMTNIEVMFVAGYLADPKNPEHQAAFEKALAAVGSTPEHAKGNSTSDVFNKKDRALSLKDMQELFSEIVPKRKDLLDKNEERFTDMVQSGRVTEYKGIQ